MLRSMTKSAVRVARDALAAGEAALPPYGSPFSRRDCTQPQLFALLALRQFPRTDYRGVVALAAHRVEFERRWCTDRLTGRLPWVCTWKCSLRLWPGLPSHSNQALRYERRPAGLDRALGLPAHRAGPDAYVTAHHLRDMLAEASLAQLIAWTREPALLVRIPYGPMRGRLWRDMDGAFLDEVLSRNTDRDVRFTARHWRAVRGRSAESAASDQATLAI